MSLQNLCNYGFMVGLTKENIDITKKHKVIIQGNRNHVTPLWDIPLNLITPEEK